MQEKQQDEEKHPCRNSRRTEDDWQDEEQLHKMTKYGVELIKTANKIQRIAGNFQRIGEQRADPDKAYHGRHNGRSGNYIIGFVVRCNREQRVVHQKDIEKEFGLTGATVSKVICHMEENGLLERVQGEKDSRCNQLFATEKAKERLRCTAPMALELEKNLTDGFTEEELVQLRSFLTRIGENLEKHYPR